MGDLQLTINGAGFTADCAVTLVAGDGTTYAARTSSVDAYTRMTATFAAQAIPPGTYSVQVSQTGGATAQLPDGFLMEPGEQPRFAVRLVTPSRVGYHNLATIHVEYENPGNVAMPAPLLVVSATQNDRPGAILTLDAARLVQGFWTTAMPEGFANAVQFLAHGEQPGTLGPGESGRVPVYYAGWQKPWDMRYPQILFTVNVLQANATNRMDWAAMRASLRPVWLTAEAWDALYPHVMAQVGTTWGEYVARLNANATILGQLGQPVNDLAALWNFEVRKLAGIDPIRSLASRFDLAVPASGLAVGVNRAYGQNLERRFRTGPFGRGWSTLWSVSLVVQPDGAVEITRHNGAIRRFEPDRRTGGYFAPPGDGAVLSRQSGGTYRLTEREGAVLQFGARGQLESIADDNGNQINATYADEHLSRLTHSSGASIDFTYNAAGRIEQLTDSLGRTVRYTYDDTHEHLLAFQDLRGRITRYAYLDEPGSPRHHALAAVTFPNGTHQYYEYDGAGRLSSLYRDEGKSRVDYAYDSAGTLTIASACGATSRHFPDHRGAIARSDHSSGNTVWQTFDDLHRVIRRTDAEGNTWSYTYADSGAIASQTSPDGQTEHFTYDGPPRRMTSYTDARGNLSRQQFDPRGNLTALTLPDGSHQRFAYDANGNLLRTINRRGQTTSYEYNLARQVLRRNLPDGESTDYAYDPQGRLLSLSNAQGRIEFAYDAQGRLANVTYPNGRSLAFAYDASGRRTRIADHLGFALNYHYDSNGRLSAVGCDEAGVLLHYTYDAAGRLAREDRANGTSTTYAYDCGSQLTELAHHAVDGTVSGRFVYAYDRQQQVTQLGTPEGDWRFQYDPQGQLVRAWFASAHPAIPDQDLTYAYDAAGNRLQTIENGVATAYTANALNQYVALDATALAYDKDGNWSARVGGSEPFAAEYNSDNRLTRLTTAAGTWTYEYDPFGHCNALTHNGRRTEYLVDPTGPGTLLAEFDETGQLKAHYLPGRGLTGWIEPGGHTRFFECDAVGSVCRITGSTGEQLARYVYDPFGQKLFASETVPSAFQFVGRFGVLTGDHGWLLMFARFYDPGTGRFVSPDPIGIAGHDLNLYRYADNAPTYRRDPRGYDGDLAITLCYDDPPDSGRWTAESILLIDESHELWPLRDCIDLHEWVHAVQCEERGPHKTSEECNRREAEALQAELECFVPEDRPRFNDYIQDTLRQLELARQNRHPSCPPDDPPPPTPPPEPPTSPGAGGATSPSGSSDPNAKFGPAGFGDAEFVPAASLLAYAVHFENHPRATAPAQHVTLSDPLTNALDWTSFELTEIAFGDHFVAVPPGRQHYQTTESLRWNGVDFELEIEAGIRMASGEVYANFRSVMPATGLPPTVDVGFLPPEDGTGRGQGHVAYTVRPKSDLPSGTALRNVALIVFDENPSLATNQRDPQDPSQGTDPRLEALVTLDRGAPQSRVLPLPAESPGPAVVIHWTGQDDLGGAGIAGYDLYVSENAGPWEAWLLNEGGHSALFRGQLGHTYAFFSVARDPVGHEEPPPLTPDAITTLVPASPPELQILWTDGIAVLAWPVTADGFVLEHTVTLADPGSWEPEDAAPAIEGDHYTVHLAPGDQLRFFRLVSRF